MSDVDLSFVDEAVQRLGRSRSALIPILQAIQEHYRYLPLQAKERVCELTEITPADLAGVSTFYDQFRHRPAGKYTVRVCIGTACHVKRANAIYDAFHKYLNLPEGDDTDADRTFTLERVPCLGCCMLAPAVQIEDVTYGYLTTDTVGKVLDDFLALQARRKEAGPLAPLLAQPARGEIRISLDTCCVASGSVPVHHALQQAVLQTRAGVPVKAVGCMGISYMEPLVQVHLPGQAPLYYACVKPEDCRELVARHFPSQGFVRRIRLGASKTLGDLLTDEGWESVARCAVHQQHPALAEFVGPQVRVATEYCGQNRPVDLDEYLRYGGFQALRHVLEQMTPEQAIEEIKASGLRGRGGAGYPTGVKWSQVRAVPGALKYVVCNADEGDPGAFMDRMLLESQPYRILEGIAIAAYAVGAPAAYIYVRAEYPIACQRVAEAARLCKERGLLGEGLFGTSFGLEVHIMRGAGAFVCGEETALLASIEGRRGMPRLRPPYPAQAGLFGKPTLVNNTETFSLIPWIIRNGAAAFRSMGTQTSKGTKVFALAGKVNRGGMIEVPMGITIHQIIEDIGGGVQNGKKFKAVQVGGPSGGCVPASMADAPIDYEALTSAGAMMGSGGMVVLDEDDCMVDIARYFLDFTCNQSCGKCTFCRIGTHHMLRMLEKFCAGQAKPGDIELLEELAESVRRGSLCGLGKTAPNPVLSTLMHFRDEYQAHIEGRCPAGVCKALITYSVTEDCIGCTLCAQGCPADAIAFTPYERHEIDPEKCIRCGACKQVCPVDAIKVE